MLTAESVQKSRAPRADTIIAGLVVGLVGGVVWGVLMQHPISMGPWGQL